MSDSAGSITQLLHLLRNGDNESISKLISRWYERLCRKLSRHTSSLSICDEEDIALNAIHDLCHSLRAKNATGSGEQNPGDGLEQVPKIENRNELWRLLSVIALRKTRDWRKYDNAKKREGIRQGAENATATVPDSKLIDVIEFNELLDQLLTELNDDDLKNVVRLKLAGFTNVEIAGKLKRSRRTVQYMLNDIREVWLNRLQ